MLLRASDNLTSRQEIQRRSNLASLGAVLISLGLLFAALAIAVAGCTKEVKPEPQYPERLPITEQVIDETILPEYQAPAGTARVTPVTEGDTVAYNGVLLDEEASVQVAELRLSYDEVYQLAQANQKFTTTVVKIQEQELWRADRTIQRKDHENAALRKEMDKWWNRHKLTVGVGIGLAAGIVLSLAAGKVWAEIEEEQRVTE